MEKFLKTKTEFYNVYHLLWKALLPVGHLRDSIQGQI